MCNNFLKNCGCSVSSGDVGDSLAGGIIYKDPLGNYWDMAGIVANISKTVSYTAFELYKGVSGSPSRHYFRTLKAGAGITLGFDNEAGVNDNSILISITGSPTTKLFDLEDVNASLTTPPNGAILFYKSSSTSWEVNASGPTNGQVPIYNTSLSKWEYGLPASGLPGGSETTPHLVWNNGTMMWEASKITFASLSDVSIGGITNGQTLVWNSTSMKFEASNAGVSLTADNGIGIVPNNKIAFIGGVDIQVAGDSTFRSLSAGAIMGMNAPASMGGNRIFTMTGVLISLSIGNSILNLSESGTTSLRTTDTSRLLLQTESAGVLDINAQGILKVKAYNEENLTNNYGAEGLYLGFNAVDNQTVWRKIKITEVNTNNPAPPIGEGEGGPVLVDDGLGGLGFKEIKILWTEGLKDIYNTTLPAPGPGDIMMGSYSDAGFGLINLDDEISNNTVVAAASSASHAASTLNGSTPTTDSLGLVGQVLEAKPVTVTTHGVMIPADKVKLDSITGTNTGDQDANEVPFSPIAGVGGLTATETQAAIAEVNDKAKTTEFSCTFVQGLTETEDLLIDSIRIDSSAQTVGINTIEFNINGAGFVVLATPLTIPAAAQFIIRVTYNVGYNTGVITFKATRI